MAKSAGTPKSFEAAITELEGIVQEMETGSISLEQALERYQRGVSLLKHCQETLSAAEQRVRQLEAAPSGGPADDAGTAPNDTRSPE